VRLLIQINSYNMGSARLAKDFETHPFVESPDDIVIAGVSCRLPESDNMQEFRDHLMNNEDMMTEDDRRYPPGRLILICF
jgi:hypothetical protein